MKLHFLNDVKLSISKAEKIIIIFGFMITIFSMKFQELKEITLKLIEYNEALAISLGLFLFYVVSKAILSVLNKLQSVFVKAVIALKYFIVAFCIVIVVRWVYNTGAIDTIKQNIFYFKEFIRENELISPLPTTQTNNNTTQQTNIDDNQDTNVYKDYYEGMVQTSNTQKQEIQKLKDSITSIQSMNTKVQGLGLKKQQFQWTDYE